MSDNIQAIRVVRKPDSSTMWCIEPPTILLNDVKAVLHGTEQLYLQSHHDVFEAIDRAVLSALQDPEVVFGGFFHKLIILPEDVPKVFRPSIYNGYLKVKPGAPRSGGFGLPPSASLGSTISCSLRIKSVWFFKGKAGITYEYAENPVELSSFDPFA